MAIKFLGPQGMWETMPQAMLLARVVSIGERLGLDLIPINQLSWENFVPKVPLLNPHRV